MIPMLYNPADETLRDPQTLAIVGRGRLLDPRRGPYGTLTAAILSLPGQWTPREAFAQLQRSTIQSLSSMASQLARDGKLRVIRRGNAGRASIYQVKG